MMIIYTDGEVHLVVHSTVTMRLIATSEHPITAEAAAANAVAIGQNSSISSPTSSPVSTPEGGGGGTAEPGTEEEEGKDGDDTDTDEQNTSNASAPLHTYTFRMHRAYLVTCLGVGSAEHGVEEVELEHHDELVRSVLRLAEWV